MCGKPIQHTRESPCGDSTHHALAGRWVPWRAKIETNLEQIKTNQNLLRFVHEIGISRPQDDLKKARDGSRSLLLALLLGLEPRTP